MKILGMDDIAELSDKFGIQPDIIEFELECGCVVTVGKGLTFRCDEHQWDRSERFRNIRFGILVALVTALVVVILLS